MRFLRTPRLVAATVAVLAVIGCATRGTSAPAATPPDLSGAWEFDMDVGTHVTHGRFTLHQRADGYGGELTTDRGPNRLPVRSLVVVRDSVTMVVESPNGLVTFRGLLSADTRGMQGAALYHNGQTYPMTVRRGAAPDR